jgi:hypothetical protein
MEFNPTYRLIDITTKKKEWNGMEWQKHHRVNVSTSHCFSFPVLINVNIGATCVLETPRKGICALEMGYKVA